MYVLNQLYVNDTLLVAITQSAILLGVQYLAVSLHGPTILVLLFMNIDWSNKRKWFYTGKKKARSRQYPPETIVLLANTLAQAESLHHILEQAAGSIGFHMNANKTEYMCFKREGAIATLSHRPLKLVEKFTYLGSNISSTETDVNS